MRLGKPDANAAELVALWRRLGGEAWYMPPDTGFDLLVVAPGGQLAVVEVKDGTLPPSKRRLTPNEKAQRAKLTARGALYVIWQSPADVQALHERLQGGDG